MKEFNENNSINPVSIIPLSFNDEENPYQLIKKKNKKKSEFSWFLLFFSIFILIVSLVAIIIYNLQKKTIKGIQIINANFTKPFLDNNKYELIKLNNGIEVLLIQDNRTEKSSLSLLLNYGFLTDLNNPGIAHLTMQYLYSEIQKKTDNDLREYFGKSSSRISRFYTSFNFYCLNDGLYKIITKFGEVFSQKINIKEFNHYNLIQKISNYYKLKSENSKNVEQHLINYLVEGVNNSNNKDILPEGDLDLYSNKTILLNYIKESINNYYYGENIKIVLYSQIKPSLAKSYIIEAFNNIKSNKNANLTNSYNEERKFKTNKIISYKINSTVPFIKLVYYIKGISKQEENVYINQAYLNYIEYILVNSYNNSLYNILTKDLNYSLRSINVYSNITFNNYIKFSIVINCYDVNYTRNGKSIETILSTIYGYIESNVINSYNETIFKYLKKAYETSFKFQDKSSELENIITQYALKLFWRKNKIDSLLYNKFIPEKDAEKYIKFLSSQFLRNNSIVIIGQEEKATISENTNNTSLFSKKNTRILNLKNTETKYYNVKYAYIDVDFYKQLENKTIEKYNKQPYPLKYSTQLENLIYPNILDKYEYIAEDNIKLIYNTETLKIYFKYDRTFKTPKEVVTLKLFHYLSKNNTKETQNLNLYSFFTYFIYLKIEIEEKLREAIIVGNIIEVNLFDDFINIKIVAFNDVVKDILKEINKIIYSPNLTLENDDIFFLQTNIYISSISDINEYWKYIIKMNYYIKNNIHTISMKNENSKDKEKVLENVKNIKDSMIVYMYFYGSLNENESKNISELFIKNESNYINLLSKLIQNYDNISKISDFINQFTNIIVPINDSTLYYVNISNTYKRNVQVFYYFGNYTKEKYNKLFLLSKILNSNHTEINIEVKILNGLFLFLEKNEDRPFQNIESSIDKLLNNNTLKSIYEQYSIKNKENGIEQFYYLKKNFITHLNKHNLNLIERADAAINNIFYNNIQFYNNKSINVNNTDTSKNLTKIELKDVTDTFLKNSFKNVKRLSIRIGEIKKKNLEGYTVELFNKNFKSNIQRLK